MICQKKEIQGHLIISNITKNVLFFQGLEKAVMNFNTFKHFKDLYKPCFLFLNYFVSLIPSNLKRDITIIPT